MQWQNTVEGYCDWIGEDICKKISEYLDENTKWIRMKVRQHQRNSPTDKIAKHHGIHNIGKNSNPYWHHVALFYDQLQGLEAGYDAKVQRQLKVSAASFIQNLIRTLSSTGS